MLRDGRVLPSCSRMPESGVLRAKRHSMWNWARHFGRQADTRAYPQDDHGVARVLLITGDETYCAQWAQIFAVRGWQLHCAASLKQAACMLLTNPLPVVVYDCRTECEEWRDAVSTLCDLPARPCVLLASSVIDENFRDDVVRLHGYDVFSRNADEDEIVRTINSAWFWKHRHA